MSKSVLVIDTPENCYDCPFGTAFEECGVEEEKMETFDQCYEATAGEKHYRE